MKLVVLILNKTDALELLLEHFADAGIKGATIISSTGMARAIGDYHEGMFLGSLRKLLDPEREENKTILTVVKDEQVRLVVDTIRSTIGDLNKPDTGIVFTVNIDYEEGILLD